MMKKSNGYTIGQYAFIFGAGGVFIGALVHVIGLLFLAHLLGS
jgi:hypothetical protein